MKKWMITGGAGFIGCHAAARLHAAGHRVILVDNLSRCGPEVNLAWLRARGVTDFVWADILDTHAMHSLLAHLADAVLHLAARVAFTTSVADPRTDFAVNALGTLNVPEAVRTAASEWRSLRLIDWVRDNAHLVDANTLVGTQAAVHAQRSTAA